MPKSQADQRRDMVATDELGRPWLLAIELKTGEPTGQILPAGWNDVMCTPQQYLRVPRDQWGQPAWGKIEIDLAAWREDVKRATEAWKATLWRCGQKAYQNKFDPATAEDDDYLTTLAGPKPKPSVEDLDRLILESKRQLEPGPKSRTRVAA